MHTCATKRNKIRIKLNNWNANKLSLVERITSAQSTLSSILTYTIQTSYSPDSIYVDIDKLCKNFIWGSGDNRRKVHLIPWSQVLLPKKMGRLGFRDARTMNMIFLLKLVWSVVSSPEALWVHILRTKYKIIEPLLEHVKVRKASNVWRGIMKI